jgi:hypothetical protein
MADIRIRFGGVMGGGAPVYSPIPRQSAKITSSAGSTATTVTAEGNDYVTIKAIGGAVAFAVGQAPVAIATSGDVVMDGESVDLGPLKQGDKVAVIDVA